MHVARILASVFAVSALIALGVCSHHAAQPKEPEKIKKGRAIGVLTAKSANYIEVKADGEEKRRKYVPRWIGGDPAQGGGLEKDMLKTFQALKIGNRVQIDWLFEERFRAVKVVVLKVPQTK
jgi:cyclic lactone autoinducer peptide